MVGNPPWINWEYLPEEYRTSTRPLWLEYGLIRQDAQTGLGKVRRDLASIFVVHSFTEYLKKDGKLGFLIPFHILKTQGADGFRLYLANNSKILKIHDLSETYPFEGATNRTGCLILGHGNNSLPIECSLWIQEKTKGLDQSLELETVIQVTKQFNLKIAPIYALKPESPWAMMTEKSYIAISKFVGAASYRAYAGVYTALTGLYWIDIITKHFDKFVIAKNLGGEKRKVDIKDSVLEKELVYSLVRGRDVPKWYMLPVYYIVLPHDKKMGSPLGEIQMKKEYPKALQFFSEHRNTLANRPIHKSWDKKSLIRLMYQQ